MRRSWMEAGRSSGQETTWEKSVCAWGYYRDHSTGVKEDKDGWAEKDQIRQGHESQAEHLAFYLVGNWEPMTVSMARAETWSTVTIS